MMWQGILIAAAAITTLAVAWKTAIWPLMCGGRRLLRSIDEIAVALPTWLDIATEFQPDDGSSLRDRIDLIDVRLGNIEGQLELAVFREPTLRTRATDVAHTV